MKTLSQWLKCTNICTWCNEWLNQGLPYRENLEKYCPKCSQLLPLFGHWGSSPYFSYRGLHFPQNWSNFSQVRKPSPFLWTLSNLTQMGNFQAALSDNHRRQLTTHKQQHACVLHKVPVILYVLRFFLLYFNPTRHNILLSLVPHSSPHVRPSFD